MSNQLTDIVFESGEYSVRRADYGFDVYRNDGVASVRCARIGYKGQKGLDRAKEEIKRRAEAPR